MKALKGAIFALAVLTSTAAAQDGIRFSGQSLGCFGVGCTPTYYSGTGFLNFTGQSFDGYTGSDGYLHLTFGFFNWDVFEGIDYIDSPFTLFLSFTNPTGISPDPVYGGSANGLLISGRLFGQMINIGGAVLNFEPNTRYYTFTGGDPNQPGDFRLTLADALISPTGNSYINGYITSASSSAHVTPEPMTMILMGSGLAGIAAVRRRRRREEQQES